MSLQSQRLAMVGLGVQGDSPPDAVQPVLPDGVHLRWARARELGFPWYGYYLFRREHQVGKLVCIGPVLRSAPVGPWPSDRFGTPYGDLVGTLVFGDDFAPAGTAEADLTHGGLRFEFAAASVARRVRVSVGLRAALGTQPTSCVPLATVGTLANPFTDGGVRFQVAGAAQCQIRDWRTTAGPLAGLDCGRQLDIALPQPAALVSLTLTGFGAPATATGFDAAGAAVAARTMAPGSGRTQVLELRHSGIVAVTLTAPGAETALHQVCFTPGAAGGPITVTALDGTTPLGSATVSGAAGATVAVELAFDRISSVAIGSGPAALVDLCFTAVAQGAGAGWQPVPKLAQPVSLPVQDPGYPVRPGPADPAGSQALALGRIRYGAAADWAGQPFTDLHAQLAALVGGGPGGPPMSEVSTSYTGAASPADPGFEPPHLPDVATVDLLLLAALNPAVAQQLGLYWVDETAAAGTSYDYLIVADDTGVARLDPKRALAEIGKGFANLDGWIAFDRRAEPAAAVETPSGVRSFALPAAPVQTAGGQTREPLPGAGVAWQQPVADPGQGQLRPGAPLMYHVWRAGLADAADPAPIGTWDLRTAGRPLLLGAAALPAGAAMVFAPDWPPFRLAFTDNGLAEGWYAYAVTGVDIFGRHSARTGPAGWHQWAPAPDPAPWYYQQPASDAELHPWAVRLLDTTPPPPPTATAAWALDPDDPLIVQDAAYTSWRGSLTPAEQGSLLGLRVSWEWTHQHMAQAPDTREFRIYLNPGSDLPADPRAATSWQTRYYVCPYGEHVSVGADADGNPLRRYEVFVPAPGDALRASLPLAPTLADPVRYALVAISAADGRTHASDSPQWTGTPWGGRYGNEGPVGAAVRIYRVRRVVPDPPVPPPADSDAVYATPADYHARSYYTYRWWPAPNLTTHVARALDDAVFRADWVALPRPAIGAGDTGLFPAQADEPRWDAAKRAQVGTELNALNALAGGTTFNAVRPAYAALSNDALRILAGLPTVARAFGQVTVRPLDPTDPATADRAGPDNPVTYQPDPALRCYLDTLDGRSTNRYFYRARHLDPAGNLSDLGLAGPPVYLPNVIPPRAPALTGLRAGDRTITVRWASNREPDLYAYRVYRAGDAAGAADVRLMTLVRTEPAAATAPATVTWDDTGVTGATTYWYRLSAVDTAGNESQPSAAVAGRAYDDSRPDPPAWDPPVPGPAAVALSWTATETDLACLVERQIEGAQAWEPLSGWLARGTYGYADTARVAGLTYRYRLRVRDARGRGNRDYQMVSG